MPEGFHFHDLRHTGDNLAAATGASTRDQTHRMGHASMRAALVYQHANSERDRETAAGNGGSAITPVIWVGRCGAGDGNRTRTGFWHVAGTASR